MNDTSRPAIPASPLVEPYLEGLRGGRLMIQRCRACGTCHAPARHLCDECWSRDLEWIAACGRGTVYSFVVFRRQYHPAFPAPYNVAVVELEEGPRLMSTIDAPEENLAVGRPVRAAFATEDGSPVLTFAPG